ncbi:hypothetical protein C4578_03365 [Candidatus Microgenomates bacterium]|nr:MAG: hypothetical protein C4578_03365 [Candidatus Microgenomates bacterium]
MQDLDIKDFYKHTLGWFNRKTLFQKLIWVIYLFLFVYEFFATRTRFQLFNFLVISLPLAFLIDWLAGKLPHKKE